MRVGNAGSTSVHLAFSAVWIFLIARRQPPVWGTAMKERIAATPEEIDSQPQRSSYDRA